MDRFDSSTNKGHRSPVARKRHQSPVHRRRYKSPVDTRRRHRRSPERRRHRRSPERRRHKSPVDTRRHRSSRPAAKRPRKSREDNGDVIPYHELPTDVICYKILPLLPRKSLMRFKCVSKSWDSLMRCPAFVTAYQDVQRKTNTINLLFHRYDTGFYSSKVNLQAKASTDNNTRWLHFAPSGFVEPNVRSINGFVCASVNSRVFIFNPTTRERIKLPRAPRKGSSRYAVYDFGFCALTNEYKVLEIVRKYDSRKVWSNILTLGKNPSWRPLDINLRDLSFDDINFCAGVFLHGAIHWVQQKDNVIVKFNFIDEKFSVISSPNHRSDSPDDDCTLEGMIEANGCVAVYGYVLGDKEDRRDKRSFVLWTLKDYQNLEWEKETIQLVAENYIGDYWSFKPLCVIQTGELAVVVQPPCSSPGYDSGPPDLRLYNMKTKAFVTHEFDCPNCYGSAYSDVYSLCTIFEDSIVSLK